MKKYAIITAAGSGSRMGNSVPKQFIVIGKWPVLMHTIQKFATEVDEIILTLPKEYIPMWNDLVKQYHFQVPHQVVVGGSNRFQSVKNAVLTLPDSVLVAVHDGVRPFVSSALIRQCFVAAEQNGNAVACVSVVESLRQKVNDTTVSVDRSNFLSVQTPQVFKSDILKHAYLTAENDQFTDDASIVESAGENIYCVEGENTNVKITYPEDLQLAERRLG